MNEFKIVIKEEKKNYLYSKYQLVHQFSADPRKFYFKYINEK